MGQIREKRLRSLVKRLGISVLLVLIVFGSIIGFFVYRLVHRNRIGTDGVFTLNTEADFIQALGHSATVKAKYTYRLSKDIEINVTDLPQALDFYGVLDGQGHTVTVVPDAKAESLGKPIFNIVKKDAVIRRLDIRLQDVTLRAEGKTDNMALLAATNDGTIKNCTFTLDKIVLGSCANVAAVVNFNYNEISNVCITVGKVDSDGTNITNWNSRFGAVATVNCAKVSNVLVDMVFEALPVFSGQYYNLSVGYIFGGFSANDASHKNIYVFGGAESNYAYWARACDTNRSSQAYIQCVQKAHGDITEAFNEKIKQQFDEIANESLYWRFTEGSFPALALN